MNKAELIEGIEKKTGHDKAIIESILDASVETIVNALAKSEHVSIVNFGTFQPTERKFPSTGRMVKKVKFSPSKKFVDTL